MTPELIERLRSCPFCGGKAELRTGDEVAVVQCLDTKMHRLVVKGDNAAADEAVEQWNSRVPTPREAELEAALRDAQSELAEAADKFWVIHCNHPGERTGRAQGEDKAFCATMADRMQAAHGRARLALNPTHGKEPEDE